MGFEVVADPALPEKVCAYKSVVVNIAMTLWAQPADVQHAVIVEVMPRRFALLSAHLACARPFKQPFVDCVPEFPPGPDLLIPVSAHFFPVHALLLSKNYSKWPRICIEKG